MSEMIVCLTCGERFEPTRSDARYCSSACRQAAYRRRIRNAAKWGVTGTEPIQWEPEPEVAHAVNDALILADELEDVRRKLQWAELDRLEHAQARSRLASPR